MSTTHTPAETLSITLLGPVTAALGGAPVPLGSRLQRGVLAVLSLPPGQTVATGQMVSHLWGDSAPPSSAGTLRAYVSRLRSGLGAALLPRVDGGYRLDAPVDAVDVGVMIDRLERARGLVDTDLAVAGRIAGEGLALWLGEPLGEAASLPFAPAVLARLSQQRRELRTIRWRAAIAAGDHASVLAPVLAWTAQHPDDEQVVGLLMVALLRSGQQSAALRAYADLRHHLAEALGTDPGPEARRLHELILAQDPDLLSGDPMARLMESSAVIDLDVGPAADQRAATGGNLPTPFTSFVGRDALLVTGRRMAMTGRLLTLTGVGGVGKTRLALEVVRTLDPRTTDGPWLVELAGIGRPDDVGCTVANVIGVVCAGTDATQAVIAALADRSTVVLLDNCEQVIDGVAEFVARVLWACPRVRFVATSRQAMRIAGEQVLSISPLAHGVDGGTGDAERLFADRAALVDPGFALDDRSGPVVRRICRALDGIPLAIELAASRLSVWTTEQLLDLLDDRFALLGDRRPGTSPHHRTLAEAIAWSYDPLTDAERAVLHAAAVFPGGFTVSGLATVVGEPAAGVVTRLTDLVDKSLVTIQDTTGERRFRVLETIREYCRERAGEAAWVALQDRHVDWALSVGIDMAASYLGTATPWVTAVTERDNLRAALARCDTSGDVASALQLCGDLSWSWFRLGQVTEGNRWLDRVLALAEPATASDPADLAQALMGRSLGAYLAGDLEEAKAAVIRAGVAAASAGDAVLVALCSVYMAYYEAAFGSVELADRLLDDAESGDAPTWVLAEVDMVRGQVRRAQGDTDAAILMLTRARQRAEACAHSYVWASSGWILAKTLLDARQPVEAGRVLSPVIRQLADQGDRSSTLAGLHTMAAIAAKLGRPYEGAVLLAVVDRQGSRMGFHPAQMDPVDSLTHRSLVEGVLPQSVRERAADEGNGLSLRQAIALAVGVGETSPRVRVGV